MAVLALLLLSCSQTSTKQDNQSLALPYYKEPTFTPHWYDKASAVPAGFHQIPAFSLYNQLGETITEEDINGKITVVDFFFTTCPGICLKMTNNMALVQEAFLNDDEVMLLSHSVTPEYDSVAVLQAYAQKKGVQSRRWHLLTGNREEIYELGRYHYFVEEDLGLDKDPDDFIHTENFVLIDGQRRIRGIYNGLNKTAIAQLIADIKALKSAGT